MSDTTEKGGKILELCLNASVLIDFRQELMRQERSSGTVEQYVRVLRGLAGFLADKPVTTENLTAWKTAMLQRYAVRTVNCMIAAVNSWLSFAGAAYMKLKTLKYQRTMFLENTLSADDLRQLVASARQRHDDTALLLEAMTSTGVRVSEVAYLTVEAAQQRMAVIRLKGKTRQLPLADDLCRRLLAFAAGQGIDSGPIFRSKCGRPLDRRRIWERMKNLCKTTDVEPQKVRPHALRHLFARSFYALTHDIAKLADILGHSSIETTRIYVATSSNEYRVLLDKLAQHFVCPQPIKKRPPWVGGRKRT